MTLKDLYELNAALHSLYDFVEGNCDGDENGIYEDMTNEFSKAIKLIEGEKYRIYLRNAKAKLKRKTK